MGTRIDDNDWDGFSRLPLEVIGLVLKKLDEDNPVEELKKCKLVSSRLYKATQDIFQDEFNQKMCTHFDGSKLNYSSSRTFGMNIFGSYKLNFPTIKISRAEYYLMKSWLEKLIPTNLQTLELKDNLLNWMEMIDVLAKFPNILKLKYIQSSDDMIVADKIFNMYSFVGKNFYTFYKKMKKLIRAKPEFLPNLKTFETEVVHWCISNILSLIVNKSQCKNLEKFGLKIDIFGIFNAEQYYPKGRLIARLEDLEMDWLIYLKRFARSMKSIEIIIDDSKMPQVEANFLAKRVLLEAIFICSHSIMKPFLEKKIIKFDQLQSLILKSPILYTDHFLQRNCQLSQFIKEQKNLQNLEVLYLDGQLDLDFQENYTNEQEAKFLSSLVIDHHNLNKKSRFGYQVCYARGMENIFQFYENLSALKVILYRENITWRFSDQNIPKFPNCLEMRIENYTHQNWIDYEFQNITDKFQNLEKLILFSQEWCFGPGIHDQDFQFIINGLPHLKTIHFDSSVIRLRDSALTGLTPEAIEVRRKNPSQPIGPEDRIGLPISHLKFLESLTIISRGFSIEMTDITAHHAFENMQKLKILNLCFSKITQEGFKAILVKTGSKNLNCCPNYY